MALIEIVDVPNFNIMIFREAVNVGPPGRVYIFSRSFLTNINIHIHQGLLNVPWLGYIGHHQK